MWPLVVLTGDCNNAFFYEEMYAWTFTGLKKTGRNNEMNVRRGSTVLIWAMIPGFSWFWTLKPVQARNIPSFVTA